MWASPTAALMYGPMYAPGIIRRVQPRPPVKMSFSARGDSPANASIEKYGSTIHDGRSRNRPSPSSTPAENEISTSAYGIGGGPSALRRMPRHIRPNTPGGGASPTSNG